MKNSNGTQRPPRFAHFTDLHVGMGTQKWLWPTFKTALITDLKSQIEKFGALDFIIFTGDLTQKGSNAEFTRLNDILREIWEVFRHYGSNPFFLPLPGNHDLVRPKEIDPTVLALDQWWERNEIQSAFWSEKPKVYRNCVDKSFQNYKKWFASLPSINIPVPEIKEGILPGDFSAELNIHDVSIGIVGLNSSWLQLTSKSYDKKLCIDPRQIMAVTENDPDLWCSRHDFNFIATHHPTTWLHPNSLSTWRSEIYTPSRFDAHYFGHMHAANTTSVSESGASARRNIQGASLFGLEFIEGKTQRLHGYGLYETINIDSKKRLKEWPRLAHKTSAGVYRLITNPEFECDDNGAIDHHLNADTPKQPIDISTDFQSLEPRANTSLLKRMRKLVSDSLILPDVRYAERAKSAESLKDNRAVWLVVDWGMGIESFLKQLSDSLAVDQENVYVLDLQNCSCLTDIYVEIESKLTTNFGGLLDALAEQSTSILFLDDAPIYEGKDKKGRQLQRDVEKFIGAALDYCPNLHIVATSRLKPISASLVVVELKPLDEIDTKSYILAHNQGHSNSVSPQFVSKLHRHTDGIPSRIDMVLRDIQIVGASQIPILNTDVVGKDAVIDDTPSGLAKTIKELQSSADPTVARAFRLLKALATFPRGEILDTVKRFGQTELFYPKDASFLIDAALVDLVELPNIGELDDSAPKALLVRRSVREYLYSLLSDVELSYSRRKATEIYFGNTWATSGIKQPKGIKFSDRSCGAWQIGNASMLVLREIQSAATNGSVSRINTALALAYAYIKKLRSGYHYHAVISLCEDIKPQLASLNEQPDTYYIDYELAQSLRMTGQHKRARDICSLISSRKSKITQHIYLCLAKCHKSLKENSEAYDAAQACIKVDKKSALALSAQAILSAYETNRAKALEDLISLESQARRRKSFVSANNIKLSIASKTQNLGEKTKILQQVVKNAEIENDKYNAMRATLELGKMHIESGEEVTEKHLRALIDSYDYLHAEDLRELTKVCHDVLWSVFCERKHTENLLRLFRLSSAKWRLVGEDAQERKYNILLNKHLEGKQLNQLKNVTRELLYLESRNRSILSKLSR